MAALVLALGGAVWLNMEFSGTAGGFVQTTNNTSAAKNLGDTKYVANLSEGEAVQTNATPTYFSEAAAARKKARDEAISLLEETLNKLDATSSAKAVATEKMTVIAKRIETEAAIETLIKAKGFENTEYGGFDAWKTGGTSSKQTGNILSNWWGTFNTGTGNTQSGMKI